MDDRIRVLVQYAVAVGLIALALIGRWLLHPFFGDRYPFFTFFAAVTIASWYGGLGPGLVATVLGALLGTAFFLGRSGSINEIGEPEVMGLIIFLALCLNLNLLSHSRLKAWKRAREQGHWLSVTLSSIGDAVIAADPEGRVSFMNPVAEQLTGWPREEGVGRPFDEILKLADETTRDPVESPVARLLRAEPVGPAEQGLLLRARDGVERLIEDSASPIRDERGLVRGVVLVFRDVTARRRDEQERHRTEALSRGLVEADLFGVTFADDRGRITYANDYFLGMIGHPRGELDAGRLRWDDLILPGGPPAAGEASPAAPVERDLRRADGGLVPVLMGACSIPATLDREATTLGFFLNLTESRQAMAGLERYRLLSLYARDVVLFVRQDGRIAEANDAALAAYGYDRETLLTLKVEDLRDPSTLSTLNQQMVEADRSGTTFETIHRRKDGTRFPVEVSARGAEVSGQRLLLSILRDISDRKATEQQLEKSRERLVETLAQLEALVAGAPFALALLDRDLRYVHINEALAEINGLPVSAHLGRTLREVLPGAADEFEPALREIIETGLPKLGRYHEGELPGRPGYRGRWVGNWYPVRSPEGRVLGVGLMNVEITEQLRNEERLRYNERRYRTLTDAVLQLMWVNDSDGRAIFFNQRWDEFTGRSTDALTALSWFQLVHPDDIGRLLAVRAPAIAAARAYECDYRLRRHDGEYRWHVARVVPMTDAEGQIENWFGTATDIHDRKIAEEALRAARDAAEAGTRARDQFLAVLSHELRNPLMPVLVAVSALAEDAETPPAIRSTLEMACRNVELEARLIDDLLDVTRIAQGKLVLHCRVVDAHELIRRAVEICRDEIALKDLALHIDLAAAGSAVEADPARLQQIVWNLIKNAAKFTPRGGSITIRTSNRPAPPGDEGAPPSSLLVLEVSDTGIGIATEALPRIFDAFEQADPAIAKQFGGLGLGLAISRSLAEALHGTLDVASPGRGLGSTFRMALPTTATASAPGGAPVANGQAGALPSLRLLLVEDNLDSLRVMARLLRGRGHRVTTAANVAEAHRAASADTFDLLISDIGLPDGSGLDLMRAIRHRMEIGGIALSGFGTEHDRLRSGEAGFLVHLTKPVDFATLEATIRDAVGVGTR